MTQGRGKYQKEQLFKTECKIVAFLNLQAFGFNELQSISGIRRNTLRDRLDILVTRKIVVAIKNPTGKARRGIYYSINKERSKPMISAYYNEGPIPPPKDLEKEDLLNLAEDLHSFSRYIEDVDDSFRKQVAVVEKHRPNKPSIGLDIWLDCLNLWGEYKAVMEKQFKIQMVKLRIKLDDKKHY